jgi:hypothetical protein
MRQLVVACALVALAGCGTVTEAASPGGITVRDDGWDMQAMEDAARAHCLRHGRQAYQVWERDYRVRYECR